MFGYIRPLREELKVRDLERYQALYCGLCHTIRIRYGRFARFFLNYDFIFLAMLLSEGAKPQTSRRRCIASPIQGKQVCETEPAMETAADETMILSYWKLRDNIDDNNFWESIPARCSALLLFPSYQRAVRRRPEFDQTVRACLEELRVLEEGKCPSIDKAADTFARILKAAAPATGELSRDRIVRHILYHVGRWIYLLDAWDDLAEDERRSRYNPILLRCEGEPEQAREMLRTTLRHSLNMAASAYHLAEFGCWGEILGNILFLGLPMVEELVFTGQWKQAQKFLPGGRNNNRRD